MRFASAPWVPTLAVALLSLSCDGSAVGGRAHEPTALEPLAGHDQSGPVGAPLPVPPTLRVVDRAGAAVPGVEVAWSVVEGDGRAEPGRSTTGEDGTATTSWTLGPRPGAHALSAAVDGLAPALFRATAHPGDVARLSLEPRQVVLVALRDTFTITARAADRFDNPLPADALEWLSSDTSRVAVDGNGRLLARGIGTTFVRASSGAIRDSVEVRVAPEVARVEIAPGERTLRALAAVLQLRAVAADRGGSPVAGAGVAWASLDPAVAEVDSGGRATARGVGTARIVASHPAAADTAEVVVSQVVASVRITPATLSLLPGGADTLAAVAADSLGHPVAGAAFAWTSSDTTVAVVDSAGRVRALRAGGATLSATSHGRTGTAKLAVRASSGGGGGGGGGGGTGGGGTGGGGSGSTGVVIGPLGGAAEVGQGRVRLDFPPGAVGVPVTVSATALSPPPGLGLLGSAFDLAPDGIVFGAEVGIRLRYDPASLPAGAAATDLRIFKVVPGGLAPVATDGVDEAAAVVYGRLSGFSTYGVGLVGTVTIDVELGDFSISVSPAEAEVPVGGTRQFTAAIGGGSCTPQWASSNPAIASVDELTGLATGRVAGGTVRIVANCGGRAASALLHVR